MKTGPDKGTSGESRRRKATGPRLLRDGLPATKDPKIADLPKGQTKAEYPPGLSTTPEVERSRDQPCPRPTKGSSRNANRANSRSLNLYGARPR